MPNDFNKPDNSTLYTDVLSKIRDLVKAVSKMGYSGDSNIPTNAIQWDNTNKNFQRENGSGTFLTVGGPVPPGGMLAWPAAAAPTGWLICDGSAISRTTYADLFAAISTVYGAGNGSTTFNIPDTRGRFILGKAASGTGSSLAATGGSLDHTHTVPAHYHGMGTGATLNITSGGAHTHSIDHDHGSVTSGSTAPSTDSQGSHTHLVIRDSLDNLTLSGSNYVERSRGGGTDFDYDLKGSNNVANMGLTTSAGAHTHTVSSHTHSVDLPNFTGTSGSTSHTHTAGTFVGLIGLVTGGVDGNASMTSGTANPPFVVANWIIKI